MRAQVFLAQRLDRGLPADLELLGIEDTEAYVLHLIHEVARSIGKDRLLAAIEADEPHPLPKFVNGKRVIEATATSLPVEAGEIGAGDEPDRE